MAFLLTTFCLASSSLPLLANPNITNVVTDQAPSAIGPYSQAICAGAYIFVSGQIAIDPALGKLTGETIEEQTKQVLKNIEGILAAEGLTLENVVKTEVYLKDLKDFSSMNKIYAEKFSYVIKPARATVQISKLPLDALIEISCVVFIPDALNR
ncbi:MAG: RidA family protein [Parachlamydiaceae bacterium]|nr:RidA family protein [Parachlamydiaceae bacterium]